MLAPSTLTRSKLVPSENLPMSLRSRRLRPFRSRRRLVVELLEDRTLLAVAIAGNVFNDLNGNGKRDAGEPPAPGATVYLDLNGNTTFDSTARFGGPTAILPAVPPFVGLADGIVTLMVAGL